MPAETDPAQVERFRDAIAARLGLWFDDSKLAQVAQVLGQRALRRRLSPAEYLESLHGERGLGELRELAALLTVPETYFFRNIQQLRACLEVAVPASLRAGADESGLRILCAGCASGEEPYTLAMLLREHHPRAFAKLSLLAVDLHPAMLARARAARYSEWSLRETEPPLKERYFRREGAEYVLDPVISAAVRFEEMNLADPAPALLPQGGLHIVFCRNVLMYFTPEQFARAVARFARALVPHGFFFLGHAETLRGVSQDFEVRHSHEAFYYQRREAARQPSSGPATSEGGDWFEVIDRAAARVDDLSAQRSPSEPQPTAGNASIREDPLRAASSSQSGVLEVVVPEPEPLSQLPERPSDLRALRPGALDSRHATLRELLEREQFQEALALLRSFGSAADGSDLLLRAALSAQAGELGAAREDAGRLLALDELNAGAHYVLAICQEQHGDAERAIHHYRLSTYLDPSFAMPHLQLGLLWRRRGQQDAARRELLLARSLIEREDPARLLMFGGGFGRAALLALCGSELQEPGALR